MAHGAGLLLFLCYGDHFLSISPSARPAASWSLTFGSAGVSSAVISSYRSAGTTVTCSVLSLMPP